MSASRKVRLDHLVGLYEVGSGEWSWSDEYVDLIGLPATQELADSIRSEGIREPVLLGNDGRVWDGHHRIVVAMHLGLDTIPVVFSGGAAKEPVWEYGIQLTQTHRDRDPMANRPPHHVSLPPMAHRSLEAAQRMADLNPQYTPTYLRRHKAGPWLPLQEGEST